MYGDYGAVCDMGMVMMSSLGSPLHVCAVGESSFSLNHPLSHYHDHLSCSILRVGHQW